jgi:uncharacterized protein YjbI with pentapeptide repeats
LAGLADDAPNDGLRQTCIDVLCAYLQLPFTPDPGDSPSHQEEHHHYLALRKVRHTILRLIGDHYRRPKGDHGSWQGCDLDLSGVVIDGTLSFDGASFSGGTVSFDGASFSGGTVSFHRASFSGGTVSFDAASFSGSTVSFDGASFSGGTVSFDAARFSSERVSFYSNGRVSFNHARFSGATVSFDNATFFGADTSLDRSRFSSAEVYFIGAWFSGGQVTFNRATGAAPTGLLTAVRGALVPLDIFLPPSWGTYRPRPA